MGTELKISEIRASLESLRRWLVSVEGELASVRTELEKVIASLGEGR